MKYYLSTFGLGNPFIVCDLPDHAVYPVGTTVENAVDLDYTALLIGTGFIIDSHAYDYILANCDRLLFLKLMAHSLSRLKQEGLLDTLDVGQMIENNKESIIEKTELLSRDCDSWLEAVRNQWRVLQEDREEFVKRFGTQEKLRLNSYHFTVANAIFKRYGKFDEIKINEISHIINSKRSRFTAEQKNCIVEATKPLIAHTVIQDLVRFKTGSLVLDWDDSGPFYSNLYKARWDKDKYEGKLLFGARNLLDVHLPHLRPQNIDGVIRFIRDEKNVTSLRHDIIAALQNGESVDARWITKYLTQVLRADLSKESKMRKIRFGGALLGLVIPGVSLATEASIEAGKFVGEELVSKLITPKKHWLYALLGEINKNTERDTTLVKSSA